MKYIPNLLSFIRLALCPVFVWAFFNLSPIEAFIIFAVASLLDVIDGYIARKFNAISVLGKILDPVADKVLQLSAVVCFTLNKVLPLFVVLVLGLKELTMLIGGGIISKKQKLMVYSNTYGKIASLLMSLSLCMLFFVSKLPPALSTTVYVFMYIALALSVISMVQYGITSLFIKKKN